MTADWDATVDDHNEYFLLKRNELSKDYLLVRKSHGNNGFNRAMELFTAESDDEARDTGARLAKKYGLLS